MSRHKGFKTMVKSGEFEFHDTNYEDHEDDPHCEECGVQDGSGRRDRSGSYFCDACWRKWTEDRRAEQNNRRNVMQLPRASEVLPNVHNRSQQPSRQPQPVNPQVSTGNEVKRRRRGKRKGGTQPNPTSAATGAPPSQPSSQQAISPTPPTQPTAISPPQRQTAPPATATSSGGNLFSSFGQNDARSALFSNRQSLFDSTSSSPVVSPPPKVQMPPQSAQPSAIAQDDRVRIERQKPIIVKGGGVGGHGVRESRGTSQQGSNTRQQRPPASSNGARRNRPRQQPEEKETIATESTETRREPPPPSGLKTRSTSVGFHGMKLQNQKALKRIAREKEGVLSRMRAQKGKPHINLVVVGHVDAGKSTLMGHFLYQHGRVDRRAMHKYEKEANEIGKGSFAYAWVLDSHEEERARGITVDVSVNHFETKNRRVTLLDSPGHRDFIPNMISGAAQADHAILVLNASTGDFEAGFDANGQTKEHSVLIRSLGVSQVILAVNKMDTVDWSQDRYGLICSRTTRFLVELGFKPKNIWPVPVSGISGENLTQGAREGAALWYSGPTLLGLVNELKSPTRNFQRALRMSVTDIYRDVSKGGPVVTGKIISGSVIRDEQIVIQPANLLVNVKNVYGVDSSQLPIGIAGDNVQLNISQVDDEGFQEIHIGDFIAVPSNPMTITRKFQVQVMTLHNLLIPICRGQELVLHVQSINTVVRVSKLHAILDKRTYQVERQKPRHVAANLCAHLTLKTVHEPVCLETYETNKGLGRVTLRRDGQTIAVGLVMVVHT